MYRNDEFKIKFIMIAFRTAVFIPLLLVDLILPKFGAGPALINILTNFTYFLTIPIAISVIKEEEFVIKTAVKRIFAVLFPLILVGIMNSLLSTGLNFIIPRGELKFYLIWLLNFTIYPLQVVFFSFVEIEIYDNKNATVSSSLVDVSKLLIKNLKFFYIIMIIVQALLHPDILAFFSYKLFGEFSNLVAIMFTAWKYAHTFLTGIFWVMFYFLLKGNEREAPQGILVEGE